MVPAAVPYHSSSIIDWYTIIVYNGSSLTSWTIVGEIKVSLIVRCPSLEVVKYT